MCGIAGIHRFGATPPDARAQAEDRATVARMLEAIAYRGPDDSGLESLGRVTLGARRLSILDVAGGHQPLDDGQRQVWAAQNGELYNYPALRAELLGRHALRTRTDTEVLPLLYRERGVACVEALRGMFALAIADTRDDTLLLARDAVGVKPLYHARVGDRLVFASELKALLMVPGLPRDPDPDGLARFLALGFIPGTATPFRAVRKLRPGCRLIARPDGMRIERWWRWPAIETAASGPRALEPTVDAAGRLIADAASAMLLSDVPVGVLLSGGLDSSVLVAMLPEAVRRETRTFTIGFDDAGRHDERAHAREVARLLGTRHVELQVPLDVAGVLPRVAGYLDEPCADPAAVPAFLVARAASREVTVLLSGTGGDEAFGGYRRHRLGELLRRVAPVPRGLARAAADALAQLPLQRRTAWGEGLVWLRKLLEARGCEGYFAAYLSVFAPATPRRWDAALTAPAALDQVPAHLWAELVDELGYAPDGEQVTAFASDQASYLPDDLLLKEDRTTMGACVEGRVPFLDVPLLEWAARLPLDMRFDGGAGKRVLRALARRALPAHITDRPKHGFSVPVEAWLRGPLDALLGDVLGSPGSGVFDPRVLRRWHDEHRRGRDRSGPLWAALVHELWWCEVGGASPDALAAAGVPRREARG